jgi:hypothetical protein
MVCNSTRTSSLQDTPWSKGSGSHSGFRSRHPQDDYKPYLKEDLECSKASITFDEFLKLIPPSGGFSRGLASRRSSTDEETGVSETRVCRPAHQVQVYIRAPPSFINCVGSPRLVQRKPRSRLFSPSQAALAPARRRPLHGTQYLHCMGMLLCNEVGLGKTALAISFISFLSQCVLLQQSDSELPIIRKQFCAYPSVPRDTPPHRPLVLFVGIAEARYGNSYCLFSFRRVPSILTALFSLFSLFTIPNSVHR